MLARIQVLLSDEHRKTRRCKTARFVSALRDQDKRAIRTWVDGVHHARPVTVPPPLIESQKQKSDNLLMDWLQDINATHGGETGFAKPPRYYFKKEPTGTLLRSSSP